MLNKKVGEAFNKHINAELFSSYLYLAMSAYFNALNLKGFAHWMRLQAQEELTHAMKFYDFNLERGGVIALTNVEGPKVNWSSPQEVFQRAYEHEVHVSGLINQLVDLALSEKDHAANAFLQWFVTEQVEEEANALEIAEKLKLAGGHPEVLLMIDRELATRTLAPAATPAV